MKTGVFHPTLHNYGGAEVVAIILANTLAKNGHQVSLFMNKKLEQKKTLEMVGEPLFSTIDTVVNPSTFQAHGYFHLYECAVGTYSLKLRSEILVDTYSCCVFPWTDVIYIHFPYTNNIEYGKNFPYLKSPRFRQGVSLPYVFFEKNLERFQGKLLLANSYFTARAIKESLGAESKVLYPPIPDTFFEKRTVNNKVRENLVVSLGRFGAGKGVELVPKIASLTSKRIRFVMIGLAHDQAVINLVRARIKTLGLEERVTILNDASRSEIKSFLARAKVFLHTTKMEHFGMSIAEAMAMGCLPIVHNSGGAPEFVPSKYRYDNLQEAAIKIEGAINEWSPDNEAEMIAAAGRFSESNFSKNFTELFTEYCKT